ncbi:MAG: cell division protein FtsL [Acidobacteriia bacterium]|nr:cell division protein FtsL [Terriglobia bacterium]
MMTDWSAGAETRNYRIPHRPDTRSLVDLLASMLCILMVAGALVGYVWIRSRIVALGYAVQNLKVTEESLTRTQISLILEEETLKNPERIDLIARNELAMQPLGPYQRIVSRFRELDARPAALALVNAQPTGVQPRRSSANN